MTTAEIRSLVEESSPFSKKLGIRFDEASATDARLRLPLDPGNLNHAGLVHAGAIYTLAETAAAALGLAAFDPAEVTFSGKAAEIRYRRPARGELRARAQLGLEAHQAALESALTEGKIDLAVPIEITDQAGERIAEATVTLSLRRL